MRNLICTLLILVTYKTAFTQNRVTFDSFSQIQSPVINDSLRRLLYSSKEDSNRVLLLHQLYYPILFSRPDSAMYFAQEGLKLARLINYMKGEALCKTDVGGVWWIIGDYTKANEVVLESFQLSESLNDPQALEWSLLFLCSINRDQGNYNEALEYYFKGAAIHQYASKKIWNVIAGSIYEEMNKPDSALFYLQQGDSDGYNFLMLGHTYAKIGNKILASDFYNKSILKLSLLNNFKDLADAYIGLAELYEKENKIDSSIYYAKKGFSLAQNASFKKWVFETGLILSRVYEKKDAKEALYYYKLAMTAKDSMFNLQNITRSLNSRFTEQLSQQQAQTEKISYQNKIRTYILLAALGFFLLLAIILWRNNRQKQKAKIKIEKAYEELKSTQSQLIQSEKMASLGELTAGIAHEIQNPLNFVNNFSEINTELLAELEEEIDKGNIEEVKAIAINIADNEQKINHHGKRADAIVKGMLQHSRSSNGVKEPTDINKLADEYLRLAYHGLRAKDKSFNATLKTEFDESIGTINIIPQDIGRVLLNLYNNAFYAVDEKKKQAPPPSEGGLRNPQNENEPTVWVSTKKMGDKVLIAVRDNGPGIPPKVLDKIFQPFFTTKPTGLGTGLGLSLSYDIVKAHGGEIKVVTKEGEGAEFKVELPV